MYKNNVGKPTQNSEKISSKVEQITFNSIRKVLPDSAVKKICQDIGGKHGGAGGYKRCKIAMSFPPRTYGAGRESN